MKKLSDGSARSAPPATPGPRQVANVEQAERIWKAFALAPLAIGTALAKLQLRVMTMPHPRRPLPRGSR
ncbi:MAG TPA: hypothetical protein VFQ53_23555 [Kofleriaceae bacterium]|nr:hypothetical protein [Kofleriaceae bacterium]